MSLTKVKLHGVLGMGVGSEWKVAVNSVAEAVHAVQILSKRKFFKFLLDNDKKGIKYQIIINGRNFKSDTKLDANKPETIANSELAMNFKDLKTIDIVPIFEGAGGNIGSILTIVAAVILITLDVVFFHTGFLTLAGLALLGAGVVNLLTSPPNFNAYPQIANNGGAVSYLFNGPENTVREGGPVPVGYGRLLIGSHVIAASYDVSAVDINVIGIISQ